MTETPTLSAAPGRPAPAPAERARVRALGRMLWFATILSALTGCYYEDEILWPQECCDTECGYRVSARPVNWREEKIGFFTTYRTYDYGDCPTGTGPSNSYYCSGYWYGGGASARCTIEAYWGATDGDGATIEAVEVGSSGDNVTARITVYIPGTGVWATPAALSIVGPQDGLATTGVYRRPEHADLIAYPGGVAMSYVTERVVKKERTIRFGLLRLDDAPVSYPVGATQQRSVSLNRPRVSTVLGSAQ